MDLMQAILDRRSIRKFKPDPVSDEDLSKILEAARWAPSWKNSQCWRFIIVKDIEIKDKLAATLTAASPTNIACESIRQAPVLIVSCAELKQSGYSARQPDIPATNKGEWYMYDVALAMEHLVLAAHSLGLGTVHIGLFDSPQADAILEVPEGYCVVSMTPLGHPDESPAARPRKSIDEFVYYEKFGE